MISLGYSPQNRIAGPPKYGLSEYFWHFKTLLNWTPCCGQATQPASGIPHSLGDGMSQPEGTEAGRYTHPLTDGKTEVPEGQVPVCVSQRKLAAEAVGAGFPLPAPPASPLFPASLTTRTLKYVNLDQASRGFTHRESKSRHLLSWHLHQSNA